MTIDSLIKRSYKYSVIYIILLMIISGIITMDYKYPLGALVGGITNLYVYTRMNIIITNLTFGAPGRKFAMSYITKYLFYCFIFLIALKFEYYSIITTALGVMSVKFAIIIANMREGDIK